MKDVYAKSTTAFKAVAAYVVLDKAGNLIARISFKIAPQRTTCFVHILNTTMQAGYATGYGYCKTDAAFHKACTRLVTKPNDSSTDMHIGNFKNYRNGGEHFDTFLRDLGYNVIQAI